MTAHPNQVKWLNVIWQGKRVHVVQQRLDRDRSVEAAIAFVDVNGLGELTMRRLDTALGVEAMAFVPAFFGTRGSSCGHGF